MNFAQKMLRVMQEESQIPDEESFLFQMEDSHKTLMPYLWTIVIDLAVFFAMYKYKSYGIYLHIIVALFVVLTTLITSLSMLIQKGMPTEENQQFEQRHQIIGTILISVIFVQILMGGITKIMQCFPSSSSTYIYVINKFHKYFGYALVVLAKVQVLLVMSKDQERRILFWTLFGVQIVIILLWIARKMWNPSLQQSVRPLENQTLHVVQSLDEARRRYKILGVFANYIYNLETMMSNHPIGYQIIKSIEGRQLDRYLYGMYTSERLPLIPTNSHSFKSIELMGPPIAKLNIKQVYSGLENDSNEVRLDFIQQISKKGGIYEVRLAAKDGSGLYYNGYSSLNQIGRYYALTINNKTTRLYTSVGFIDPKNVEFLEKYYFKHNNIKISANNSNFNNIGIVTTDTSASSQRQFTPTYISLLMKKYPKGLLTSQLINKQEPSDLRLSSARGEGLQLNSVTPGKVVIIAGGTGLFPFSDLINLLFKAKLVQLNPALKAEAEVLDPVLADRPFASFSFKLLLAVNHVEDIHPITFVQLKELNHAEFRFEVVLKTREAPATDLLAKSCIRLTTARFQELVEKELATDGLRKVWVCGPPSMNQAMLKLFDITKTSTKTYIIL